MADKKMNDFATASDGAYIYAESSSGEQIKISKADLASVVAELFSLGDLNQNVDNIYRFGIWTIANPNNVYNLPFNYGVLICFKTRGSYPFVQFAIKRDTATIAYRTSNAEKIWGPWLVL